MKTVANILMKYIADIRVEQFTVFQTIPAGQEIPLDSKLHFPPYWTFLHNLFLSTRNDITLKMLVTNIETSGFVSILNHNNPHLCPCLTNALWCWMSDFIFIQIYLKTGNALFQIKNWTSPFCKFIMDEFKLKYGKHEWKKNVTSCLRHVSFLFNINKTGRCFLFIYKYWSQKHNTEQGLKAERFEVLLNWEADRVIFLTFTFRKEGVTLVLGAQEAPCSVNRKN